MARPSKKDYLLKLIRLSKGLSGEDVASKVGVALNNVWRAEVGRILSESIAIEISNVLGISSDIMFYNMGRFPPDKREFIMKDPIFFKELIEDACKEPWKLTTTQEYMEDLKSKIKELEEKEKLKTKSEKKTNPEINKILSRLMPSE